MNNIKYKDNQYNGRVNIVTPDLNVLFSMQDNIPIDDRSDFRGALTGNWENNLLSDTFFSSANIQIIQNGIRAGVYKRSNGNYIIPPQNTDELKVIMRAVYLMYSKNLSMNIKEQIKKLNDLVLDYAIPQVYGEAEGYLKYKKDVSTMYTPIAHPILSRVNDKQLELKKWF